MLFDETKIKGCYIIEPEVFSDDRGFFLETYQKLKYKKIVGNSLEFVQDNMSESSHGVLRGLHYQKTRPQGKLVQVIKGEVLDVVVDIRKDSETFGNWISINLSSKNKQQVWIPPGLAHGFITLSNKAIFHYKATDYYFPQDEATLMWNDKSLNIDWAHKDPIVSKRDSEGILLKELNI